MPKVTQALIALAFTGCIVQISQALPTLDGMMNEHGDHLNNKRDSLPLVGNLLGSIITTDSGTTASSQTQNIAPIGNTVAVGKKVETAPSKTGIKKPGLPKKLKKST